MKMNDRERRYRSVLYDCVSTIETAWARAYLAGDRTGADALVVQIDSTLHFLEEMSQDLP